MLILTESVQAYFIGLVGAFLVIKVLRAEFKNGHI